MNGRLSVLAALLAAGVLRASTAGAGEYPAPGASATSAGAAGEYVVVTAPETEVLALPAANAEVLLKGVKGDLFALKGQKGEWYHVSLGDTAAGWIRREAAALLLHPEFLDPERLRESYTPPPYVSPRAWRDRDYWDGDWRYWRRGHRDVPYPWRDPLWWGIWLHEERRGRGDRHDRHDRDDRRPRYRPPSPPPVPRTPPPPGGPRPR